MNKHIELPALSDEQVQAVYKEWLDVPGNANEFDLIRMAGRAAIAAHEQARVVGEPVAPDGTDDLHDFTTHRLSWRKAIEQLARIDDSGYWSHELRAYDKAMTAFDRVAAQPATEQAEAPNDLKEQLRKANQQFVDVSVALMRYVPESESAAKSALQQLGDAHGYGWCQSALGKMWDEKHGCAPRGSMGVTVKDGD